MKRRLFAFAAILPFLVVALVRSGGGEEAAEPEKRSRPAHVDLNSAAATIRDYRHASSREKQRFVEIYAEAHFGRPEPVAAMELRRHLDSQIGGMPTSGDQGEMLLAATGRTPLWDAALRAAEILGWPER